MQSPDTMHDLMRDTIQYIMLPKIHSAPECGTYVSYGIAAYDGSRNGIVAAVEDVTTDRELALHMVSKFNRNQLSPCHLKDAVTDML